MPLLPPCSRQQVGLPAQKKKIQGTTGKPGDSTLKYRGFPSVPRSCLCTTGTSGLAALVHRVLTAPVTSC